MWYGSDPAFRPPRSARRRRARGVPCCTRARGRSHTSDPSGKGTAGRTRPGALAVSDRSYFLLLWVLCGFFGLMAAAGPVPFTERIWRAAAHLLRIVGAPLLVALRAFGLHLTWRVVVAIILAAAAFTWGVHMRPWPSAGSNPLLDFIAMADPLGYQALKAWYLAVPAVAAFAGVFAVTGAWRVWVQGGGKDRRRRGLLPPWPPSDATEPRLVVGELHHPTAGRETEKPTWLTIPERGLYTGIAIFGAVGTGKTSACMHPFARQLFTWNADNAARRAAGLVLEVKGDFCYDIRRILKEAGREDDYLELGLHGRWQWNPLDTDMDSYSLAYSIAALLNQLYGKGKEPFWQQASTNLVRWIIELHRALPANWCTLRDVYRCAIDPDLFAARIEQARDFAGVEDIELVHLDRRLWIPHVAALDSHPWTPSGDQVTAPWDQALADDLTRLGLPFDVRTLSTASDHAETVRAVDRWYRNDWLALDAKLRTSIVEGISVFLSMFDLPDVSRVFCPPPPPPPAGRGVSVEPISRGRGDGAAATPLLKRLPRLDDLIDAGKVLAFNMPAGSNPALSRAAGVLLKNAWLQALLKRPAAMKQHPNRYYRPAVFICDEYQSFATVGEDDPSGDEKSFALTRQCRCIPIVATQSISSLRSVLPGQDAWRALIQTLRTRIFLSLSDAASASLAAEMCGKARRYSPSYSFSEQAKPGFGLLSGRAGGGKGSVGASKSYREVREPVFHPRAFTLLGNCEAICLPYDGVKSLPATRVYLKPYYLPRELPYWRAREEGRL